MANLVNDIKPFCLETMNSRLSCDFMILKRSNGWIFPRKWSMSGYKWNGKKWVSVKLTY